MGTSMEGGMGKVKKENQRFGKQKIRIVAAMGTLLLDVILSRYAIMGIKLLSNMLFTAVGQRTGEYLPTYQILANNVEQRFALGWVTWQVVLLLGMLCYLAVRWENLVVELLLLAVLVIFQGLFGKGNSWMLFLAGLGILMVMLASYRQGRRKGRVFFLKLFVLEAVFLLSGSALFFHGNENVVRQTVRLREAAAEKIDSLRYGTSSLWEGKIAGKESREAEETVALKVFMQKPQSMYLRGFVGSRFLDGTWKSQKKETLYEQSELFFWLHKEGFYPQCQPGVAAESLQTNSSKEKNKLRIENVGASRKYRYHPYEVLPSENLLTEKGLSDEWIKTEGIWGKDSYEMECTGNQVVNYPQTLAGIINGEDTKEKEDYRRRESYYNAYVYQTDTELTQADRKILENHLGTVDGMLRADSLSGENDGLAEGDGSLYGMDDGLNGTEDGQLGIDDGLSGARGNVAKAKERILQFLGTEIHYDEDAVLSGKEGFLREFLEQKGAGNETAYATAAVLMFRYYGIPARYVEGYLITPQDVEECQNVSQDEKGYRNTAQDREGYLFASQNREGYRNVTQEAKGYRNTAQDREGYLFTSQNREGYRNVTQDTKGYLSPPQNAQEPENGNDSGQVVIEVSEQRRHAWVEYYQDGVGFLPFEVCPPYIGVMESASDIQIGGEDISQEARPENDEELENELMDYTNTEGNSRILKHILFYACMFLAAALIIVIVCFVVGIFRKKRNFRQKLMEYQGNRAARNLVDYLFLVLFSFRIVRQNVGLDEYESSMKIWESKDTIRKPEENPLLSYKEMLAIYRQARFGNKECDKREREQLEQYCRWILERVYQDLKFWEKCSFHMKYGFIRRWDA